MRNFNEILVLTGWPTDVVDVFGFGRDRMIYAQLYTLGEIGGHQMALLFDQYGLTNERDVGAGGKLRKRQVQEARARVADGQWRLV